MQLHFHYHRQPEECVVEAPVGAVCTASCVPANGLADTAHCSSLHSNSSCTGLPSSSSYTVEEDDMLLSVV